MHPSLAHKAVSTWSLHRTLGNFDAARKAIREAIDIVAPRPRLLIAYAVLAVSLDGGLRAYSAENGKVLWQFDTNRAFETVNGVKATGAAARCRGCRSPSRATEALRSQMGYASKTSVDACVDPSFV